jgi:hypothetical protein
LVEWWAPLEVEWLEWELDGDLALLLDAGGRDKLPSCG